jgi:DNA-binding beta-propeller fold protein YncE
MRRKPPFLVSIAALGVVLAACTSSGDSPRAAVAPDGLPREVLFVGTAGGPVTIEVPTGSVLFEREGALASPDGATVYAAVAAGGRTVVETNDAVTGEVVSTVAVPGAHDLGVVSGSGRAVALVEPLPKGWEPGVPIPRSHTTIVVADPTGASEPRTYRLRGNYEPEAFSVQDDRLFLIQHLPAEAPVVYRVTMLDLQRGRVYPVFGPYKGAPERMPGTRLEQVLAPDGMRLYTLYTSARPGYAPHGAPVPRNATVSFVHVLDLREGWAHCVGLPRGLWSRPAEEQAMAVSPDGSTLYVVDAAVGLVAAMDTTTLGTRVIDDVPFGVEDGADASAEVSADGTTLFVTAGGATSSLFALETSTFTVDHRWTVDGPVSGLGLSADGVRLYVANGRAVGVLDPLTGDRLADVPLPSPSAVLTLSSLAA